MQYCTEQNIHSGIKKRSVQYKIIWANGSNGVQGHFGNAEYSFQTTHGVTGTLIWKPHERARSYS